MLQLPASVQYLPILPSTGECFLMNSAENSFDIVALTKRLYKFSIRDDLNVKR